MGILRLAAARRAFSRSREAMPTIRTDRLVAWLELLLGRNLGYSKNSPATFLDMSKVSHSLKGVHMSVNARRQEGGSSLGPAFRFGFWRVAYG